MKPRSRSTSDDVALSALLNAVTVQVTNLRAISQTLASGRVGGRTVRDYAVMCASEASKLTRLVETFVRNELQATVGTRRHGPKKREATPQNPARRRQRRGASTR
ncbi:MAG TPA: hypothetical protein VF456_25545 [Vicinamibacterales bacterium]